jgi:peptide/nickel transport system permease protein
MEDGKAGSILFHFRKPSGTRLVETFQEASVSFSSSYEAPQRFTLDLYWNLELSGNVTARMSAIVQDPKGNRFEIWERDLEATKGAWLKPAPRIDSWSPQLRLKLTQDILGSPEEKIFLSRGEYLLILRVLVWDKDSGPVDVQLYVDDVEFRCYGAVFGLLGTDQFGADLFSQLVYGARISLAVGVLASLLSVAIGTVLGIASGYLGGAVDQVLMRFNDMLLVLPGLPLLLVLIAVLGPTVWNVVILIGLLRFMSVARVIRSQVLSYKERPFIEAAKAAGAGPANIMFKQLFPNVMSLAFAQLALSVPAAIASEASLSWLGLGDPTVPTWGRMLYLAHYYGVLREWWWIVFPGLCIALVSIAFIFVGHAMDEILNPRLRPR